MQKNITVYVSSSDETTISIPTEHYKSIVKNNNDIFKGATLKENKEYMNIKSTTKEKSQNIIDKVKEIANTSKLNFFENKTNDIDMKQESKIKKILHNDEYLIKINKDNMSLSTLMTMTQLQMAFTTIQALRLSTQLLLNAYHNAKDKKDNNDIKQIEHKIKQLDYFKNEDFKDIKQIENKLDNYQEDFKLISYQAKEQIKEYNKNTTDNNQILLLEYNNQNKNVDKQMQDIENEINSYIQQLERNIENEKQSIKQQEQQKSNIEEAKENINQDDYKKEKQRQKQRQVR